MIAKLLADELSKKHQVMYLCLGEKFGIERRSEHLFYLKIPASNINDIWVPILSPKIIDKLYKELDNFHPDVIHSQNIIFGGLISLIWAKERNVPYVITFHSIPHESMTYVFPKLKKGRITSYLDLKLTTKYVSAFLNHVDKTIALNKVIVKSLEKINPKTQYSVINNGIKLKRFNELKIQSPDSMVKFIFPGSYLARKNQEYLLNVFRFLPENYFLNLFGNKRSGHFYMRKLEKIIKQYNIKNVILNDYLSEVNILKAYENSNYLVSASIKEVQSLVIIEALAAGKPVIALRNETTSDLINTGNGLLLPQKTSPKIFADNLKYFVEKTNQNYPVISEHCRKSVEDFDIENVSEKIVNVYKDVINLRKQNSDRSVKAKNQLIQELIPNPLKEIFNGLLRKTVKRKKVNTLKLFLIISSIIGGLGLLIAYLIKLKKHSSKIYFGLKRKG